MNYKNIIIDFDEEIAIIVINRPDKLNALNSDTISELHSAFDRLINEEKKIRAIVVTGSGEKAFVAGADISELSSLTKEESFEFSKRGHDLFNLIENSPKPVIAAINGFALGGGCELALACHIRYASENAKFGQPEINLGLIPGFGGTQRLTRLIGKAKTLEFLLTGENISANDALSLGLINKKVLIGELLPQAVLLAKKICTKSSIPTASIIHLVNISENLSLSDSLEQEIAIFSEIFNSEDFKEGTEAFLQKRKPNFKNK